MPVNDNPVAPNTAGGFPAVTIVPGVRIGQKLYEIRTNYTTVNDEKQLAVFGQLVQGTMPIEKFANQIKRIGKIAKMSDP